MKIHNFIIKASLFLSFVTYRDFERKKFRNKKSQKTKEQQAEEVNVHTCKPHCSHDILEQGVRGKDATTRNIKDA